MKTELQNKNFPSGESFIQGEEAVKLAATIPADRFREDFPICVLKKKAEEPEPDAYVQ